MLLQSWHTVVLTCDAEGCNDRIQVEGPLERDALRDARVRLKWSVDLVTKKSFCLVHKPPHKNTKHKGGSLSRNRVPKRS